MVEDIKLNQRECNFEIFRLAPEESARLRGIRLLALKDSPQSFESSYEELSLCPPKFWLTQLSKLTTFIAVQEGNDVGMVRASILDDDRFDANMISLWVTPSLRKQGIGTALVKSIINWAFEQGVKSLNLHVKKDNKSARLLYQKLNFVDCPNSDEMMQLKLR